MGSFVDDIAAAVDALGVDDAGVVWGIGMTRWSSDEERNNFLASITQKG
jgi:hypothetical protein